MSMDPNSGYPQQPYAPPYTQPPTGYPEQQQQPYQPYGQPPAGYPGYPQQPPAGYPGYPNAYAAPAPMPQETSGMAIASLICSFFVPLVGVILGHIALSQINNSNGRLGGRGVAIAGLVVGYAFIALSLLFVVVFFVLLGTAASTNPSGPSNFLGALLG